jgi:hypothetical protein
MSNPPLLRAKRLDALVVNPDGTVTGTFTTAEGQTETVTIGDFNDHGAGNVTPTDFFMGMDGTAEAIRSVISAARSILRAHDLSPLPDSN